jgi:hypothetical protein
VEVRVHGKNLYVLKSNMSLGNLMVMSLVMDILGHAKWTCMYTAMLTTGSAQFQAEFIMVLVTGLCEDVMMLKF